MPSLGDIKENINSLAHDTVILRPYYTTKESIADVLGEIGVKAAMVECGLEEFTACEKLALAIINKSYGGV